MKLLFRAYLSFIVRNRCELRDTDQAIDSSGVGNWWAAESIATANATLLD